MAKWLKGKKVFAQSTEQNNNITIQPPDNLTIQVYHDANGNGLWDEGEEALPWAGVTVELEKLTTTQTIHLLEGWTLVSMPLRPTSITTASDLILDVAKSGGYVTTVARWQNDRWEEFVQRGGEKFGQDFLIEPGKAYFLRNHKEVDWTLAGYPLKEPLELELVSGWNTIGFPKGDSLKASEILDRINLLSSGCLGVELGSCLGIRENSDLFARWESGRWEIFLKRIYSAQNIQEYGEDFPLEPSRGYLLRLKEGIRFQIGEEESPRP